MRLLRIVTILVLAAGVMIGCMLWVSQFFGGQGEGTPVIWLEKMRGDADGQEDFIEFEEEDEGS